MYAIYGEGLTTLNDLYTSNGSANVERSKRCERTSWNTSPARMCSLVVSTASRKADFSMLHREGGFGALVSEMSAAPGGKEGMLASEKHAASACTCTKSDCLK